MQRWEQQGYTPKKKLTLKTVSSVLDEPSNYGSQSFAHPSAASDVPVQFLNENYKSLPQELKKWSTADVVRWLDQQGLAKQFAVIFNENQVTGTTLVEGNLHFLDTLKEISLEDRELLLSSIYELLNPNSIQVKEDDLKRFTSNAEREKYLAAVHVAQSKDTHLHLVEATSPNAPSAMSTSSSCSSPFNRHLEWPNHDNDTSCMHQSHISLDEREVTTESCSMSSFANDWGSSEVSRCVARQVSLYELLSLEKRKEVCCIDVNRPENSHFEFNVETTEQGHVLINEARGLEINPGDRILEVNGVYICNENDLKQATKNCDWLRMVVVRSEIPSEAEVYEPQSASFLHESKNLKNQTSELKSRLSSSEWRWKKLRDLVLQMKEKDIDVLLNDGVNQKTEEAKDKYILQEEIRQLQEALNSSSKKINHLQKALESKTTALQELGSEHEQLRKKIENQSHKSTESDDSLSQEGYADQECWRNLSDSKAQGFICKGEGL
ncbi:X-box-binding protein 1 [Octopus vulgaris]|uniref:X-box-binding protein 1 n=1 Tax=Octopus vulgaris TaxID=6645 RepID=A0AA36F8G2_OCTVU|nr:X-box-binding protein 1 [Octopus vulgaris]